MAARKNPINHSSFPPHKNIAKAATVNPLITIQEAEDHILSSLAQLPVENIPLADALGRTLATDIKADRPAPPFDRVMMDGICINTYNYALGSWRYKILNTPQAAGAPAMTLPQGEFAIEVMTGAILPVDANAVIPVEKYDVIDGYALPHDGVEIDDDQFIHPKGSDTQQGDTILTAGTVLHSAELAVAASVGGVEIPVFQQPRIQLLTTGDEVIDPAETPENYQIRRTHPTAITALIKEKILGTIQHQHLADDPDAIETAIKSSLTGNDVLILTGGISMGKFDWVAPLLKKLLGEPAFHGVRQRPGKPFAYWKPSTTTPAVFALPGNPVSVMATMHRYVLPALRQMQQQTPTNISAPLASPIHWKHNFPGIVPYKLIHGQVHLQIPRNSGDYLALAGTHGFAELSTPSTDYPAGTLVSLY